MRTSDLGAVSLDGTDLSEYAGLAGAWFAHARTDTTAGSWFIRAIHVLSRAQFVFTLYFWLVLTH